MMVILILFVNNIEVQYCFTGIKQNPSWRKSICQNQPGRTAVKQENSRRCSFSLAINIRQLYKIPGKGFSVFHGNSFAGRGWRIRLIQPYWSGRIILNSIFFSQKTACIKKTKIHKRLPAKFEYNWLKKYRRNNSSCLGRFYKGHQAFVQACKDTLWILTGAIVPFMLSAEGPALATGDVKCWWD